MKKIAVGVVGASGFTGLELIKILLQHPHFELSYLATTEGGGTLADLHPALLGVCDLSVEKMAVDALAECCELAFLAVPHKSAMALAAPLLERGVKVVDLSADYRLAQETYEAAYCPHSDVDNLSHAVYGLPEMHREAIASARLIANPGCYPTAALLGVLPFITAIDFSVPVIVDAKSGASGAGKKCVENTHFITVNDNCFTYAPLAHRHQPEMIEKIALMSGQKPQVLFTPHLLPITRGMLASIYVRLKEPIDAQRVAEEYYRNNPFVRVRNEPVSAKQVAGTHFCDLFVRADGAYLLIGTAIDNLLRGASSAAVANANLMMGLEEAMGLPQVAYVP